MVVVVAAAINRSGTDRNLVSCIVGVNLLLVRCQYSSHAEGEIRPERLAGSAGAGEFTSPSSRIGSDPLRAACELYCTVTTAALYPCTRNTLPPLCPKVRTNAPRGRQDCCIIKKRRRKRPALILAQCVRDQPEIKTSLTGSETNLVSPRLKSGE